jgi:hypothetical protein
MTVNQETGQLLTPDEIREIKAYVSAHRKGSEPFEIAVNGETPLDPRQGALIVAPYRDAGATWWVEYAASRDSLDAYRERIRRGPPKT